MRVIVFYKDRSDSAREVIDFLRDLESQTGHQPEIIDPESREGVDLCGVYGLWRWPAIIAISDDGVLQKMWLGTPLPTINEISFYFR